MLVVKKDLEGFYEEKKSKFYTYIFKVESKEEIASKIQKIKDENPQARHVLYMYILNSSYLSASENKEPINSMHSLLDILNRKKVYKILVVVVRYFGGILLGASNLDRLYVNLPSKLLENNLEEEVTYYKYQATIKNIYFHQFVKELTQIDGKIISKEFDTNIVKIVFEVKELEKQIITYLISYQKLV